LASLLQPPALLADAAIEGDVLELPASEGEESRDFR
jgi:hypothetical protein